MKTLGDYQNNIAALSKLKLENYERIFKLFDITSNNNTHYVYNILKKIEFPAVIATEFTDTYKTPVNLPLTIISHNVYANISLWWVLYLLNKSEIGTNIFVVPGGTTLKYIKPQYLETIFAEITNNTIFNGRHF